MSIADSLATNTAIVAQTIRGKSIFWKVRKLTPRQLGILPQAMKGVLLYMIASQGEKAAEAKVPSEEEQERFLNSVEQVARLAVVGVSTDGETFEPITLVAPEDEDGNCGWISVAILDPQVQTLVLGVALAGAMEAGELIRPFRGGRDGDCATP